ncbi:MAG: phenylalanine--tRNA ligase subunit beta [Bacillota bacterium]
MKLPLKWLKEYVNVDVTDEELVEKLMWRGFEVASIDSELGEVEGVVVGRVLSVEDHPNANSLHVCRIDAGTGETLTIVCGAPNVAKGALVPVAKIGAKLPGKITIGEVEMRGVKSSGMLCSGKELGLTEGDYPGSEVHGLLLLQGEHAPGEPIEKALGMDDVIFEIELTPNRADCQSIIGMCREVASALGKPFFEPVIRDVAGQGNASDYARVTVENAQLCPRYAARVVADLKIEPSPAWMQKKLKSVGMRPINNIVDITNLVMAEYGHPMHPFDLACISQGHIIVRNAYENEVVVTLDSKPRNVTPDMLLIADPERGVAVAGVMGGENSEITENTKAALFEAAVFKGSNIRATCRKLRHKTDAAARFIKGVEAVSAMKALNRAIELVDELKAGTVIGGVIDVCESAPTERKIRVDWQHVNRILNTSFTAREMADMLATISISSKIDGEALIVSVPHYRVDIESSIEADWDIAEEIARIYGYYNIEPTLMRGDTFLGRLSPEFAFEDRLKDEMVSMGAYEMYNYNFTGPAVLDELRLPEKDEKRRTVRILNPFGEDQSLMRTTLLPGMLGTLSLNVKRRTGHGRFFEVGNVHFEEGGDLPTERKLLGIAYMGENEDFFTLKGSVEWLLRVFGIENASFRAGGGEYLHPGRKAEITLGEEIIGELGEIHPAVARSFELGAHAFVAEIEVAKLFKHQLAQKRYAPLPRFPVVVRDLAVIVDESVQAASMKETILRSPAQTLVEDVELFDVFKGNGIPEGKKSMAYSFTLRATDRTLTDEDIKQAVGAILGALQEEFGAILRV